MGPFLNDPNPSLHDRTEDITTSFIETGSAMAPVMLTTGTSGPIKLKLIFHKEENALFQGDAKH